MLRIIDGKRYNTETADELADATGGGGRSDFNWWHETLYRTSRGAYFICGEGHANSRWACRCGDGMRGPGSGIRVITEADARAWVERYCNNKYEEIFGEAEEA